MTYRGTVRDGVIVPEGDTGLQEGTVVEITPVGDNGGSFSRLPAFGIWRDRDDMKDPAAASRRLRQEVERRGKNG